MTEAEGALFRAQALRKIGNTQGSMAAFKEYHDLTMAEQKKAMMFANDDELSTKISDLTGRDVDVQTNKDGAKEVTVDGKKSHTFGSQEALLNFGFGMLDNDPQASLQAVTASNKEATQSLLVRGEMQKITSSIRNAAEELQLRKRSDFRTQTEWEQAQGEYKQMQADADILDDPSNAYTRPDEYAQAASRAGRNRYTSKEINTSTQTVDPTTQMVTRAPANRAIEAGKAEAARIASDPWVVGKVIGTGNGQFGVRGPDGKAYPANSFAHAQRLAKRLYPNGPPVAAKAK
jgi:hypothetical protein